jgi:metal-dependent amidase/aminoacylase/carboxypeptidase family protein/pimeloyl-ACP methyl ester carboxylesterase
MSLKSKASLSINTISILLALFVSQLSANPHNAISNEDYSRSIYPELLELRRDLFKHPEVSGQEKRTSAIVADYLSDLGLEVKTNVGGHGVVGILKGSKAGKHIVWRADMDAAYFEYGQDEKRGGEHKKVGHVCGHDVHATIGLGIAKTLARNIENLYGTVYFLFQPAEESQQGAKAMIKDGLFDMIQADEIYAAHVGPMPTGVITTSPGNVFSHSRYINIEFTGTGDAETLSEMVNSMMKSVTRVNSPDQFTNLLNTTDPKLGLGNPETIYQDYVLFGGRPNLRKSDDKLVLSAELFTAKYQDIEFVMDNLEQQIRISKFKGRFSSIEAAHDREGVNNNAELVSQASQIIKDSYGDNAIVNSFGRIPFASEDFGHFQKTVPGVYFFIGVANADKGNVAFPHLPNFEVDEMVIHHGVSRFSTLIERRLQQDISNAAIENASLNQCTVGLYRGTSGNFVALTKANTEYSYSFKDNKNGTVNAKALVTQCGDKSISLSDGDIWPLIDIRTKNSRFMSEGIALQGRLMLAKNADNDTPLVVYAHGSESNGWIDVAKDPYLMLARGVSVFVYDKRGTGLSEGQYTQNFPLLAKDLVAAAKEAKRLANHAYGRFGLIGLSQGGWVAPLAANDTKADFIVIAYGLVADIREEDAAQVAKELRDAGFGVAELAKAKQLTDATALIAASGYKLGLQALDDARDEYKDEPWYTYIKGGYTGTFLQRTTQYLSQNGIPFYDNLNIDWSLNPLEVMQSVSVPQLWVLAEEDREAPIALTMERLGILKRSGKPIDIYVFPNTDHGMWEYSLDEQGHRQQTKVTEGFYELLVDWVHNRKQSQYGKGRKY